MTTRLGSLFTSLRVRDFRIIWEAQILSELGDWAARVALAVLIYDRTGSPVLTAWAVAVSMLPWLGLGQALAAVGDRYPRRTVMVVADLARALAFGGVVLVDASWMMLLLAFLAATATPPFEAARAAVLPDIVSEERYPDALTLSNITYQAVLVLGYLAGGGLVAVIGPELALAVNAATFLLSGLLLMGVRGGHEAHAERSVGAGLRDAVSLLAGDPVLRRAAILTTIGASAAMVGEVLVAVHVKEHLGAGSGTVGLLAAMVPVGTITASVLVPRHGPIPRLLRASAAVVLFGGVGAAVGFALEPGVVGSALAYVSLGAVFAVVIPAYAFVGPRLPTAFRGTAFSVLQGTLLGGQALAGVIAGLLASAMGASHATAVALLPALGFAVYAFVVVPDVRIDLAEDAATLDAAGDAPMHPAVEVRDQS